MDGKGGGAGAKAVEDAAAEGRVPETAGVGGKPMEAVCANLTACSEPALARAAENVGRGGSWKGR